MSRLYLETEHQELFVLGAALAAPASWLVYEALLDFV